MGEIRDEPARNVDNGGGGGYGRGGFGADIIGGRVGWGRVDGVHHQYPRHPTAADDDDDDDDDGRSGSNITGMDVAAQTQEQFSQIANLDQDANNSILMQPAHELDDDEAAVAEFLSSLRFTSSQDDLDNVDDDGEDEIDTKNNSNSFMVGGGGGSVSGSGFVPFRAVVAAAASSAPPSQASFAIGDTTPSFLSDGWGKDAQMQRASALSPKFQFTTPPPHHHQGKEAVLSMVDAKFSPIVWRSFNDLQNHHRGGRVYRNASSSINGDATTSPEILVGTSLFKSVLGTSTITTTTTTGIMQLGTVDDEGIDPHTGVKLPPIPSPPLPTCLLSEQTGRGPPKIPTLRNDDTNDTATISSLLLYSNNNITTNTASNLLHIDNIHSYNDKEEDEEVAAITSTQKCGRGMSSGSSKKCGDNNSNIKLPPLVPRKRSFCFFDNDNDPPSYTNNNDIITTSSLLLSEERLLLPSSSSSLRKYWIPPRRPTKKSRLFVFEQLSNAADDGDDRVGAFKEVDGDKRRLFMDQEASMKQESHHLHQHGHHVNYSEEGSMNTFSFSSSSPSSSCGISIATPKSYCSDSSTFSIQSSSLAKYSRSGTAATKTAAVAAAAKHTFHGQFVTVSKSSSDKKNGTIMTSENREEEDYHHHATSNNIFFTPPRTLEAPLCL